MKRSVLRFLSSMALLAIAAAGCDALIGLNAFYDCPGDARCPPPDAGPEVCEMDGKRDGKETDVDCGGGLCPACGDGKGCGTGADCASKVCVDGSCHAPACDDGVQNGDETGIDCGGPTCKKPCANGQGCEDDADCQSGVCKASKCVDYLAW
jgi:hypothetical protein